MNFDTVIERRHTHSMKWDMMEALYGVPSEDGIAMWVADMDFRAPPCVQQALAAMTAHGIYGYYGDERAYRAAICWWMDKRHGWQVAPETIFTTHGLVNGTALCVESFTAPGDAVVLFTPVYHAFARLIAAAGRQVVECPLVNEGGRYRMDFARYDAAMTGREKMVILCSPHNPGGRVWSREELQGVADFAKRHDLILLSDEIHHDLVYPGHTHIPMALIDPALNERLVMMSATTKAFNIAGAHSGNVIIPDAGLRARFGERMVALGVSVNAFGVVMATAAYSLEGAQWIDALMRYLQGNRRLFDETLNAIPGLRSMPLEATYLAWVDFSGTGMAAAEFTRRVEKTARIAVNHGPSFGTGGENFLRFNIAMARDRLRTALDRLGDAFGDLQ
ncbi:MAG: pyridoxal phosphate-dependent aminotransferase [Rhodobacteraceae bacterium]|nr:pyridoxal phosphate-dependent aminotransferase [Paracoccaceae bacterium]